MKATRMLPALRKPMLLLLTVGCCALISGPAGRADSLWERRVPRRTWLVEDSRARRVGDLLTVTINQSTEVDNNEAKELSKTNGAGAQLDIDSSTGGDFGTSSANLGFDASGSSNRNFSGEASYSNSRAFQDRITVRVIDIDPAGNLVIHGQRGTHVTGEHRVLSISGTVRPIDIAADNMIDSRFITDMHLIYDADGAEPKFTRQGWLGRFMNKVWPF